MPAFSQFMNHIQEYRCGLKFSSINGRFYYPNQIQTKLWKEDIHPKVNQLSKPELKSMQNVSRKYSMNEC